MNEIKVARLHQNSLMQKSSAQGPQSRSFINNAQIQPPQSQIPQEHPQPAMGQDRRPPMQFNQVPQVRVSIAASLMRGGAGGDSGIDSQQTPLAASVSVSQHNVSNASFTPAVGDSINAVCVRQFATKNHENGAPTSALQMLMHMTRGNGASKEIIKPGSATLAEEEKAEIASLRKIIGPEEGSLDLRSSKLEVIPRPFYKVPFNNLSDLDIRGNEITAIEDAVCINLAQLRKLDARANRIREVSPHIKAMMSLQVLRLDGNLLEDLPCEIGELSYLEELTFAENKVKDLHPQLFSKLCNSLRVLNFAENKVKHIPPEIGSLRALRSLIMHSNRFTSLPCTIASLAKGSLEELSLEWFHYAKPPRLRLVKRGVTDGAEVFEQLVTLCQLLVKYKMQECALITFLENYSVAMVQSPRGEGAAAAMFNVDHIDNRMRTPLHNACVKGDLGVVEGLLLGKANPNTLDKDNCTPLCLAIREDRFDAAALLINSPGVDVNKGGGIYGSPMHLAVVKLEVWLIKKLLMKGAFVNQLDCDGNAPLHLVMSVFSKNIQKCTSICELLIAHGARANIKNNDNWAPIHVAARKGQEKGIQTILKINQMMKEYGLADQGFDVNVPGGVQNWTALHLAAHGGHFQIIKDLVHVGFADIFLRNNSGQLPRHCAKGNYIITKYFKLCEKYKARGTFQSHLILTQYELLQNVSVKSCLSSPHKAIQGVQGFLSGDSNHLKVGSELSGPHRFGRKMSYVQGQAQKNGNFQSQHSQSFDMESAKVVQEDHLYVTFQKNLTELKLSKTFQELDLVKRKLMFENQVRAGHPSQLAGTNSRQQCRTIKQMPAIVADKSEASLQDPFQDQLMTSKLQQDNNDSRFSKLNQKAEEMKKVNLFYLKDIVAKPTASHEEKMDCLWKIKRNVHKPVFGMAMKSLITDFTKINDILIQQELLSAMQCSNHSSLVQPLKDLLKHHRRDIDDAVIEDIEDTIHTLSYVAKNPSSYQVAQPNQCLQSQNSAAFTQRQPLVKDKSRNVNTFKMKGMTSLMNQTPNLANIDRQPLVVPELTYNQMLETEVLEDNFVIPKNLKHRHFIHQRQVLARVPDNEPARGMPVKGSQGHAHQLSMALAEKKPLANNHNVAEMGQHRPNNNGYHSEINNKPHHQGHAYHSVMHPGLNNHFHHQQQYERHHQKSSQCIPSKK